jgi:hypothetical protein
MTITESILKTEYSTEFDEIRKRRMVVSFYKYGPISTNAGQRLVDEVASLKDRLQLYIDTGNLEYLADVANFAMIEFMYPQHESPKFIAADDKGPGVVGMSIREIERFKECNKE